MRGNKTYTKPEMISRNGHECIRRDKVKIWPGYFVIYFFFSFLAVFYLRSISRKKNTAI